jgi:hypothetical protein
VFVIREAQEHQAGRKVKEADWPSKSSVIEMPYLVKI